MSMAKRTLATSTHAAMARLSTSFVGDGMELIFILKSRLRQQLADAFEKLLANFLSMRIGPNPSHRQSWSYAGMPHWIKRHKPIFLI